MIQKRYSFVDSHRNWLSKLVTYAQQPSNLLFIKHKYSILHGEVRLLTVGEQQNNQKVEAKKYYAKPAIINIGRLLTYGIRTFTRSAYQVDRELILQFYCHNTHGSVEIPLSPLQRQL